MKLLFHGTKQTEPEKIYSGEYGLDNRFSREGMYGNGIYFANNSKYSNMYRSQMNTGEFQMFFCFVNVGESVQLQPTKLTMPPLKTQHRD